MAVLTNEHIAFITRDLAVRGIVLDEFADEMLDHLCSLVEEEMHQGTRFIEAYQTALSRFGHTKGLRQTQHKVLLTDHSTNQLMFRNYFKIALRNLTRHRFYSMINVAGLATGVAACLIITLFILHELSYDTMYANADRIYRTNFQIKFGKLDIDLAVAPAPAAEALLRDYPEVAAAARLRVQGPYLVRRDKDSFREGNITYADSSFFSVFSIPFLSGNPRKALTEPNTIVISRKIADKYFPNENPIGQTLTFYNEQVKKVVGVIENFPVNSQFHFDILLSMLENDESKTYNWMSSNFHTYLLLKSGTDPKALEMKMAGMQFKYMAPQVREFLGKEHTDEKMLAAGDLFRLYLMPLTDVHLHARTTAEIEPNGDITYLYLFGGIAFFILVIACINFMNLSTARSANRAKEVGIRKVLGSLRSHLVRQFLLESVLVSVLAFLLSVGIAFLLLPAFNDLANKQLSLPWTSPVFYLVLICLSLLIGALAGIYPSLFLSAFRPINVLKGRLSLGMKSGLIRSGLVVFQFGVSIFLIIGTLTIYRQLEYIQKKKIGFNKEQVIIVKEARSMGHQLQSFKNELLRDARIQHATISGALPVAGTDRNHSSYWLSGKQPDANNMVGIQRFYVDHDYVKTLGMEIVEGRDFSRSFPADSMSIIINESAARAFGIDEDPIGKKIETFAGMPGNTISKDNRITFTVVGVVKNFHFESMRNSIAPLFLFLADNAGLISFRFESKNTKDVIATIEKKWKEMVTGQPFEYSFLDDDFANMYATEQRLGKIFGIFAGLAIVIASLGLFALSAFTAEQRTKEIGIRKVLGATVSNIVKLLSMEFGRLIIIAFLIAAPLSWFAVNQWLEGYTYKAEIGVAVYLRRVFGIFAGLADDQFPGNKSSHD